MRGSRDIGNWGLGAVVSEDLLGFRSSRKARPVRPAAPVPLLIDGNSGRMDPRRWLIKRSSVPVMNRDATAFDSIS